MHDFPSRELAREILYGVKPQTIKEAEGIELKFNPDYYRILTREEVDEADLGIEQFLRNGASS